MKASKILSGLACLACNIFQAFFLCKLYFAYETCTKLNIEYPAAFIPPSAVICFNLLQVVNWDVARDKFESIDTKFSEVTRKSFVGISEY